MISKIAWTLALIAWVPICSAAPQQLVVDENASSVTAQISATMHSFAGDLGDYQAEVLIDPDSESVTGAVFRFSLADLDTGNESRNQKMVKWADVDQFGEAVFRLSSVERSETGWLGHGTMALHGFTREIEVPFTLVRTDEHYVLEGDAVVDYTRFGLKKIRMLLLTVHPEIGVHFRLEGGVK